MDGHIFLYSHVWQDIKASNSPKFDPDSPSADDQVPIGDAEIPTKISPQKFPLDPSINLYPDL